MDEAKQEDSLLEDSQKVLDLESATTGGRLYTRSRWTIGDSTALIEGEPKEPLLVTLAWVLGPLAVGVLFLGLLLFRG